MYLRRLATVSSAFQLLNFDGSVLQIFISCYNNNDIDQMSNQCWISCGHFRDVTGYYSNSFTWLKTPLIFPLSAYNSKNESGDPHVFIKKIYPERFQSRLLKNQVIPPTKSLGHPAPTPPPPPPLLLRTHTRHNNDRSLMNRAHQQ